MRTLASSGFCTCCTRCTRWPDSSTSTEALMPTWASCCCRNCTTLTDVPSL
ncbi:Uncharacterised protein [Bordetella pertussis]|nr:Uncharacterised protein [Bordetella pertussis]CPK65381.1 Uncharacterised protein [Bordetella pertussis]